MELQNPCLAGAFSCFLKRRRSRDSSADTASRWTSGRAAPGQGEAQGHRAGRQRYIPLRLRNRLKRLFTNSSHSFFSGTMLVMQISYRSSTVQCTYKGSHRLHHRSRWVKSKIAPPNTGIFLTNTNLLWELTHYSQPSTARFRFRVWLLKTNYVRKTGRGAQEQPNVSKGCDWHYCTSLGW